jgi:hypothetical protein
MAYPRKINGWENMVESTKYGWRQANPSMDVDSDGRPVESYNVVIVEKAKCRRYSDVETTRTYYDPKGVEQAVKLSYGGTYYGYTEPKVKTAKGILRLHDGSLVGFGEQYTERKVFMVYDGRVYTTTRRHPIKEYS